jgi:DnaJ domain
MPSAILAEVSVPAEIPGIGSTSQKLRVSPSFDPMRAGVAPEEYFVMSRIDGTTSLRDVIVTTGLPLHQAISIVSRLRNLGALLLPGEAPRPSASASSPAIAPPSASSTGSSPAIPLHVPASSSDPVSSAGAAAARPASRSEPPARPFGRAATEPPAVRQVGRAASESGRNARPASDPPSTASSSSSSSSAPQVIAIPLDTTLPDPSDLELAVLAAELDVTEADRRTILAMARRIGSDPWTILGVARGTDPNALKKIYFRLSKDVHPDRHYGKRLGPLASILSNVFESVSRSYTTLTEAKKQRERNATASSPQTPADHAIELFDRGCAAEVSGDLPGALQLFAASLRVDPQLRVYRRGASCALAAGQPKLALEYAKKAQTLASEDPSNARLLARAFRSNGELSSAEEVLVFALALPIDNDSLMAELRADLALVRKQLTHST